MNSTRPLVIAVGLILGGQLAFAQDCVRCGQHWNARQLATVAAHAAWTVEHDPVDRRVTDDSPEPALGGSSPTERLGGRP